MVFYLYSMLFVVITLMIYAVDIYSGEKKFVIYKFLLENKAKHNYSRLIVLVIPYINILACIVLWIIILSSTEFLDKILNEKEEQ